MPRYDYECPQCGYIGEYDLLLSRCDDPVSCDLCFVPMRKIITKMPLYSYSKRPQDRLWGTSHLSSSEKFREKQKRKGEK